MMTVLGGSLQVWKSTGVGPLDLVGCSLAGGAAALGGLASVDAGESEDGEVLSRGVALPPPFLNLDDLLLLVIAHHIAWVGRGALDGRGVSG